MRSKYSAEEKFQIVMESFTDNVTQAEICRRHGIYPVQLSKWREQFIIGGKSALAQRRNSDSRDEEIQDLKRIISNICNRRLSIVHFRRNKSDPQLRFNFDAFRHVEGDHHCMGWRIGGIMRNLKET